LRLLKLTTSHGRYHLGPLSALSDYCFRAPYKYSAATAAAATTTTTTTTIYIIDRNNSFTEKR